jgi:hypothetical protein
LRGRRQHVVRGHIVVSCIGETWVYYLLGSAVEVVLLLAIARTAWKWPRRHVAA